jgi:2-hydroxy-6-oxonona-2,4-dienedioate hydrolase
MMPSSLEPNVRSGKRSARIIGYPVGLGPLISRVLECGAGTTDLLLLHGAGSRADRWVRNLPGLAAAGHRVRALDLPGHGYAAKPVDFDYTTPAMAALIEAYLIEHGPAVLIGTSLGGHIATWVAVSRPDLVPAVVLIGVAGVVAREASTSTVLADRSPAGVRAKLSLLLHDQTQIDDAWVREETLVNTSPGAEQALDRLLTYLRGGINEHLTGEQFAASGVPARLIWGAEDRWIPLGIARRVVATLPSAPLYVMKSAGHAPYFERPDTFNDIVLGFLTDTAHQKPGVFEV